MGRAQLLIDPIWVKVTAWIISGLVGVLVISFWWGFRSVILLLISIKEELHLVGMRTVRLETWIVSHDKQDDARHQELKDNIADIRERA